MATFEVQGQKVSISMARLGWIIPLQKQHRETEVFPEQSDALRQKSSFGTSGTFLYLFRVGMLF